MKTPTLSDIEKATCDYAAAHSVVADRVKACADEIEPHKKAIRKIEEKHLPGIKRAIESKAAKKGTLEGLLRLAKSLFEEPRTITLHGIEVGLHKNNGSLEFKDETRTIELIKQHLGPMARLLIRTKEEPNKKTIRELPEADLQKIEASIVGVGDAPVISAADDESLGKLIDALMKSAEPKKK